MSLAGVLSETAEDKLDIGALVHESSTDKQLMCSRVVDDACVFVNNKNIAKTISSGIRSSLNNYTIR